MSSSLVQAVRLGNQPGGPLLVLLHGLGSNERDLMAFAPYLDPRLTVVGFRAPRPYGFGGFAWFDIEWLPEGKVIDEDQAEESRSILIANIERLRTELSPSRVIVGGFSQGAMMSLGVALSRPDLVDGVLMMSGRGLPRFLATPPSAIQNVPFFVQHGVEDEVLPIEDGREVRDALQGLGVPLEYREYPMGHEVNMNSLQDAIQWVASVAFATDEAKA